MMIKIFFTFGVAFLFPIQGSFTHANTQDRRHVEKHVHGEAELEMAFDGPKAELHFACPAESILGFEAKPKSEAQKKKWAEEEKFLKENFLNLVIFDPQLQCKSESTDVLFEVDGKHAAVDVKVKLSCAKGPQGSKLVFKFFERYPKMHELNFTGLADKFQISKKLTAKENSMEVK